MLSSILVSQWETLPPSLASQLEPYCLGTGLSGELLAEYTKTSTENLPEVSIEQAKRMAEDHRFANTPEE